MTKNWRRWKLTSERGEGIPTPSLTRIILLLEQTLAQQLFTSRIGRNITSSNSWVSWLSQTRWAISITGVQKRERIQMVSIEDRYSISQLLERASWAVVLAWMETEFKADTLITLATQSMPHLIIEEKSRSRTVQVNKMASLVSVGSRTSKTYKVEHLQLQTWIFCVSSDTTFTIGWETATRQKKLIHTKKTIRLWTKAQHPIRQRRES